MKLFEIKIDVPDIKGRKVTKHFGKMGGKHESKKHKKRAKRKQDFRRELKNQGY